MRQKKTCTVTGAEFIWWLNGSLLRSSLLQELQKAVLALAGCRTPMLVRQPPLRAGHVEGVVTSPSTSSIGWYEHVRYVYREVDIGLVLALLLGVADGDVFERIDAVHAVLAWRSRRQQVTEGATALYIAALKVRPRS